MAERFDLSWREAQGLRWLAWEGAGVAAAFPTREGGVSPAPRPASASPTRASAVPWT